MVPQGLGDFREHRTTGFGLPFGDLLLDGVAGHWGRSLFRIEHIVVAIVELDLLALDDRAVLDDHQHGFLARLAMAIRQLDDDRTQEGIGLVHIYLQLALAAGLEGGIEILPHVAAAIGRPSELALLAVLLDISGVVLQRLLTEPLAELREVVLVILMGGQPRAGKQTDDAGVSQAGLAGRGIVGQKAAILIVQRREFLRAVALVFFRDQVDAHMPGRGRLAPLHGRFQFFLAGALEGFNEQLFALVRKIVLEIGFGPLPQRLFAE